VDVCERRLSVDSDAECDQYLQNHFGHRNGFVLPFSLTMDAHAFNAPPPLRILGGINAHTYTVEKSLQMYSLSINTATMQQGRELFALVSRCVKSSLQYGWRTVPQPF
jgi:hypothetical protein